MNDLSANRSALGAFLRWSTIIGALCLGNIGQVWAHARPEAQTPAAGAVVSAPQEVLITFDEALEPAFSRLIVSDARGRQVTTAKGSTALSPGDEDGSSHGARCRYALTR